MEKVEERQSLITETFNDFNGKNINILSNLYDEKVEFEDPVTKVKGLKNLKSYYENAYAAVKEINFDFKQIDVSEDKTVYTCQWIMNLKAGILNYGRKYDVRGVSIITFSDESNKVVKQSDYLDLGDMVYERLPAFGSVIKAVKSKLD